MQELYKSGQNRLDNKVTLFDVINEQIVDNLPNTKDIQIPEHSSSLEDTSVQNTILIPNHSLSIPSMVTPAPQDRWSQEKHIELVNIIGNPGARMLTRAMAKELSAASAHECLFVDFLSKKEPKKVFEALQHPVWVDAMQEELNQFARNKVFTLVPAPYGKTIIGSKWKLINAYLKKNYDESALRKSSLAIQIGALLTTIGLCLDSKLMPPRVLINKARIECQNHKLTVEDPVEYITRYIAGLQQKPFGMSTLIPRVQAIRCHRPRQVVTKVSHL
ncbi:retrovirus-related pol polyprotein from transposon TNT 1-94 [Tanacetum coccineum]